jgi:hypothetical protein
MQHLVLRRTFILLRTDEAHIRCLGMGADIAIPAGDDKAGANHNSHLAANHID